MSSATGTRVVLIIVLASLFPWAVGATPSPATEDPFPIPVGLEARVAFWVDVFSRHGMDDVIIHDRREPWVVHQVLHFDEPFDTGNRSHLRRVRDAQKRHPKGSRFQVGMKEKFVEGLVRSTRYMDLMRPAFETEGIPEDLAYLPHVESSFQIDARSSAACVGMWQWSLGTGRAYLVIDRGVDERYDPILATEAAARHLAQNYQRLGSWPLAITAYNHGVAGMARAKRRVGGDDFDHLVRNYRGRSFGFASQNFYAEFLAVRIIASAPEAKGLQVTSAPALRFDEIELADYVSIETLVRHLGLSENVLREWNPAIRKAAFQGDARLPRGYRLRVPEGQGNETSIAYAKIPSDERHSRQIPATHHVVRTGDSLSRIARRYGTSVHHLTEINGIRNPHRIYRGQKILVR